MLTMSKPTRLFKCLYCGERIGTTRRARPGLVPKYCSTQCNILHKRAKRHATQPMIITCRGCGDDLPLVVGGAALGWNFCAECLAEQQDSEIARCQAAIRRAQAETQVGLYRMARQMGAGARLLLDTLNGGVSLTTAVHAREVAEAYLAWHRQQAQPVPPPPERPPFWMGVDEAAEAIGRFIGRPFTVGEVHTLLSDGALERWREQGRVVVVRESVWAYLANYKKPVVVLPPTSDKEWE